MLICSFPDCGRKRDSHGLCSPHAKAYRMGKPLVPIRPVIKGRVCSFPDCGRPYQARDLCYAHYQQLRAGRPLTPVQKRRRNGERRDSCAVTQCAGPDQVAGWCRDHYHYRVVYGVDPQQVADLWDRQGGRCAVCGSTCPSGRRLSLDHDHNSGAVRGLLCGPCNRGIGLLRDDPELLDRGAQYLREFTLDTIAGTSITVDASVRQAG